LQREFGFQQFLFRMGQVEIGKNIAVFRHAELVWLLLSSTRRALSLF